eukprot:scaffold50695_cov69-Phaeocystis_antarctica.AAC.5
MVEAAHERRRLTSGSRCTLAHTPHLNTHQAAPQSALHTQLTTLDTALLSRPAQSTCTAPSSDRHLESPARTLAIATQSSAPSS